MREDFLAITLKAFRLHPGALEAIAEAIQVDLTAVHGKGWHVAIGRDVWRVLRTAQLTNMTLKCVSGDPASTGLLVMAYKCSDDKRVPAVAAPLPPAVAESAPEAEAGKTPKGKTRQDATSANAVKR
jgi:hypothetical protein